MCSIIHTLKENACKNKKVRHSFSKLPRRLDHRPPGEGSGNSLRAQLMMGTGQCKHGPRFEGKATLLSRVVPSRSGPFTL